MESKATAHINKMGKIKIGEAAANKKIALEINPKETEEEQAAVKNMMNTEYFKQVNN